MKAAEFCYWLQGYFELGGGEDFNAEQVACIRRHLNMVFLHDLDPKAGSEQVQKALSELHTPLPKPTTSPFPSGGPVLRC